MAVGFMANATFDGVTLTEVKVEMEGDIDVSRRLGAWGDVPEGKIAGFTAVRLKAYLKGDASREVLNEIVQRATKWSPVASTLRNNVQVTAVLAD